MTSAEPETRLPTGNVRIAFGTFLRTWASILAWRSTPGSPHGLCPAPRPIVPRRPPSGRETPHGSDKAAQRPDGIGPPQEFLRHQRGRNEFDRSSMLGFYQPQGPEILVRRRRAALHTDSEGCSCRWTCSPPTPPPSLISSLSWAAFGTTMTGRATGEPLSLTVRSATPGAGRVAGSGLHFDVDRHVRIVCPRIVDRGRGGRREAHWTVMLCATGVRRRARGLLSQFSIHSLRTEAFTVSTPKRPGQMRAKGAP